MKILHIGLLYHSFMGGGQRHMKGISETLVKSGENVTVFTLNAPDLKCLTRRLYKRPQLPESEAVNGVAVKRFGINYNLYNLLLLRIIPRIRGGYRLMKAVFNGALITLSQGPLAPRIIWEIIKFKPEIVMVLNGYGALPYFCYLAKKFAKFPLVIIPCLHIGQSWVENKMLYKIMRSAELIIALTGYEKDFLVNKGIDAKKICVIGVGIEPDMNGRANQAAFRQKHGLNGKFIILFVGRNKRGKGAHILIEAMKIVWENSPDTVLVLAGAESHDDADLFIENKLKTLSNEERKKIILIKNFTEDEKDDIFSSCDIFALPSNSDSFGIVYLEAWMHKKPVIACRDTAQASLISEGEDGLLVEHGNSKELASAISLLIKNDRMRLNLGERGKEKVLRNYTWDIIGNQIREQYYKLVNNN